MFCDEQRRRTSGLPKRLYDRSFAPMNMYGWGMIARTVVMIVATVALTTVVSAQGASSVQDELEGWPPVPPLKDQSVVGNYCIHRNLVYSMGDVLCIGGQGLVCVPPSGTATGGRAYWSSAPVSRGDINWTPPAHCGK